MSSARTARAAQDSQARSSAPARERDEPRSAGLCEACDHRRQTEVLISEAGLLAATWSADLSDQVAVAAVATEVRTAINASVAAEWAQVLELAAPAALEATSPQELEDPAAHDALLTAGNLVAEYWDEALVMLSRSLQAQAQAEAEAR
ncbi:hypothetical protein [Streptomyces sp. NPDC048659]|uniref:hypothetical protein n=1 Tax=Streptomyces sp. NPDC048659 TaxID=3155489 RepID=UPI00341A05C7